MAHLLQGRLFKPIEVNSLSEVYEPPYSEYDITNVLELNNNWTLTKFVSPLPLAGEELDDRTESYYYPVYESIKMDAGLQCLFSYNHKIISRYINFSGYKESQIELDTHRYLNEKILLPLKSGNHANTLKITRMSSDLSEDAGAVETISLWGNDIINSYIFSENQKYMQCHFLEAKALITDFTYRINKNGNLGLQFRDQDDLLQMTKLLRDLIREGYVTT